MSYSASAPGSLMLMGEYAVLHGKQALVCAINKRITVTLTPRTDKEIHLYTADYGEYRTSLAQLKIAAPYTFVTACLYQYRHQLKLGCDIKIASEFSDQVGLGSSAAVTVATLATLEAWLSHLPKQNDLAMIRQARALIRQVQGRASGADVAASVLGGIVAYRAAPLIAEKIPLTLPLTIVYSGAKTPTREAIKIIQERFSPSPQLFKALCLGIHASAQEALAGLRENNLTRLGKAMNIQQGLMQALGVSTAHLDNLITELRGKPSITGAKISGSGLGDCIIGLGDAEMPGKIQAEITLEGLMNP
jgi:mevalonate kinase